MSRPGIAELRRRGGERMAALAGAPAARPLTRRAVLATLPRTDLRITQSQMRAAGMNATSDRQMMIAAVSSVFAAIAMLVNVVIQFRWASRWPTSGSC